MIPTVAFVLDLPILSRSSANMELGKESVKFLENISGLKYAYVLTIL